MTLKIFYWNCGSGLVRKLDFIFDLIRVNNVDVFFVSEADFSIEQNPQVLNIDGYETVFSRTLKSRNKSRLLCFKKSAIQTLNCGSELDEVITLSYQNVVIVGLYRPFKCYDGETERTNLDRLLRSLGEHDLSKETFIIGDFNIDIDKAESRFYPELMQFADSKALTSVSLGITRARWVRDNLQESAIDFILTNSSKFKTSKEFCELSDHCVIKMDCFRFDPIIREKKVITITNWKFDLELARNFLDMELKALPILSSNNVDDIDYWIRACLIRTSLKFVKVRKLTSRNSNEIAERKKC